MAEAVEMAGARDVMGVIIAIAFATKTVMANATGRATRANPAETIKAEGMAIAMGAAVDVATKTATPRRESSASTVEVIIMFPNALPSQQVRRIGNLETGWRQSAKPSGPEAQERTASDAQPEPEDNGTPGVRNEP